MTKLEKMIEKNPKLATGEILPNNRFKTPLFRVSYPHLYKPSKYNPENPKYGITMLFDTESVKLKKFKKLVETVISAKWGNKPPKSLKRPFHDGEEKAETDGYGEGIVFCAAYSDSMPGVIDIYGTPCEDMVAGDYARATVNVYAYENQTKGAGLGLQNVQFICRGEPFGATRIPPEDDFDQLDGLDEDTDEDDEDDDDEAPF